MKKILVVLLCAITWTVLCRNAFALSTYIPHITAGENDWTDYLQINNNTIAVASFTLNLYSNGDQIYSQLFSVNALSHLQIELKTLNPSAETGIITYTDPGLIFRTTYNHRSGGVAEFKTINTLESNVGFYFSDFTNVQWKGAAIANVGTTPAQVTLYAIGGSSSGGRGSILATRTETINPRGKIVGAHSVWFSSVNLIQIESIVAVTNSASLCGIAISGDSACGHLLFTPAIQVDNFNPGCSCTDKVGNWVGTVTGNDVCGRPYTGTSTLVINSDCSASMWTVYSHGNPGGGSFTVSGSSMSLSNIPCTTCNGATGIANFSGLFTGKNFVGTYNGCGSVDNYMMTMMQ